MSRLLPAVCLSDQVGIINWMWPENVLVDPIESGINFSRFTSTPFEGSCVGRTSIPFVVLHSYSLKFIQESRNLTGSFKLSPPQRCWLLSDNALC